MEYVATPTSATPTTPGDIPPNSDVIIADESEVFTEGATVEIVETTPLPAPQPMSPKRRGPPPYRGRLLLKLVISALFLSLTLCVCVCLDDDSILALRVLPLLSSLRGVVGGSVQTTQGPGSSARTERHTHTCLQVLPVIFL